MALNLTEMYISHLKLFISDALVATLKKQEVGAQMRKLA